MTKKKRRRCGFCGRRGHTKTTCPQFLYSWTQGLGGPGRAQPLKKPRKIRRIKDRIYNVKRGRS